MPSPDLKTETNAAPPPQAVSRPQLLFSLALCHAGMMCLAIAVMLPPVLFSTLSADIGGSAGLSKEQLGRIAATTFAGIVIGIIVAGPLADRIGAKLFAVLGNVFIATGLVTLGVAKSYINVVLASFMMGFGAGILDMLLSPIVSALQPHRRASAMNWLHAFYSVGAIVTVAAIVLAWKFTLPWRNVTMALCFLPLLTGGGFLVTRLPPFVAENKSRTPLLHICRQPVFIGVMIAIFFGGGLEAGVGVWLPDYGEAALGFSKIMSAIALLCFAVMMAIGRMSVGAMTHRVSPFNVMLCGAALSVILVLVASFSSPAVALVACLAVGLSVSPFWPSILGVASNRFPEGGASMFAMLSAMGNIGGILTPWFVGSLADATSMKWGMAAVAIYPIGLIALLIWLRRQHAK